MSKFIELEPENTNGHFDLAVIYADRFREKESSGIVSSTDLEDLKKSLNLYLKVIHLDSEFPHASNNAKIIKNIINKYE